MSLSLHAMSLVPIIRGLGNLNGLLDKAVAHADARKIDPAALLSARLFPDMYPLTRQVQLASDFAKGCGARLAGVESPAMPDTESTFDELKARIGKTLAFLETLIPERIDGPAEREIVLTLSFATLRFTAESYVTSWVLPNFYFHLTTAYNVLRHNGVELGKTDFLGKVG